MNLNRVELMGRLTKDVEMRQAGSDLQIASVDIAVNRRWYDRSKKEWLEKCAFVQLTAFGKTAENIQKVCCKGSPIYCEGRLENQEWTDKQSGAKRSKLAVILDSFQSLEPRSSNPTTLPAQQEKKPFPKPVQQPLGDLNPPANDGDDLDVPF